MNHDSTLPALMAGLAQAALLDIEQQARAAGHNHTRSGAWSQLAGTIHRAAALELAGRRARLDHRRIGTAQPADQPWPDDVDRAAA